MLAASSFCIVPVSNQLLIVTALLERRKANLLVKLHGLRHCADAELIEGHPTAWDPID